LGVRSKELILWHRDRKMRILIAGRQAATRSALRMLLQEEDGLTVVGEAVDSQDVLRQLVPTRPDTVVLDWDLPGGPVQTLLSDIHALGNHTHIVVLSGRPEDAGNALAAGADAFISKANPPMELVKVLHGLGSGEGWE
jgi:DNA-binding NarL/FixJ family response regulator